MRMLDLSSWQSIVTTLIGLALVTLIGVGIRLLVMMTIQQRRERLNRQINERLRTLIASYKVLGGSFTGDLTVDPSHLRDRRRAARANEPDEAASPPPSAPPIDLSDDAAASGNTGEGTDRRRRIRDAVEAALSDIILLGTAEQVALAARAARELSEGRPVHTQALVIALRDFIRDALDLDPIPGDVVIPMQGPTRPTSSGGGRSGGSRDGGGSGGGTRGGGGGGGGMGMAGMGMAGGLGLAGGAHAASGADGPDPPENPAAR
jgi:uncharacterized membrane protein YgcG